MCALLAPGKKNPTGQGQMRTRWLEKGKLFHILMLLSQSVKLSKIINEFVFAGKRCIEDGRKPLE